MPLGDLNKKWWRLKKSEDPHKALWSSFGTLESFQNTRRERNRDNLSRYLNQPYVGMKPGEMHGSIDLFDPITLNVTHSAIATVGSKICMHRPVPTFLTQNGSWELQEKAKRLQKFVMGIMSQNKVHEDHGPKAFFDCAIFDGPGALKVFRKDGKICVERVLPNEIVVDEEASITSSPREMMQVKWVTKDALIARYPKHKERIKQANGIDSPYSSMHTDIIEVREAWHLESKKGHGDGWHMIATENVTLEMNNYERETFPFAFMRWDEKPTGFYGLGLAQQLAPLQDELDKTLQSVQDSNHMLTANWVILDKNSSINKKHLKNLNAIIIEKNGGPDPKIQMNSGINPQVLQYIDYLKNSMFEISGVSQLSASSQLPERLRGSGAALRTMLDTETQRFGLLTRQWESLFVDIARLIIMEARDMAEAGEDVSAAYSESEFMEKIDFKSCNMEDGQFTMKVQPTDMLPHTPGGKLAMVSELTNLGAIQDPGMVLDLLQFPDVDKFASLETANVRSAHKIAEFILSGDDNWIPPEKFMDLGSSVKVCQKYWIKGHMDGVPEIRLDNLARWINDAMDIIEAESKRLQQDQLEQQAALQQAQQPPPQPTEAGPAPDDLGLPQELAPPDVDPALVNP